MAITMTRSFSKSLSWLLLRYTEQKDLRKGRTLHAHLIKTGLCIADKFLANGIIAMYAKMGFLSEAELEFEAFQDRDAVSWNCLISGYSQKGSSDASRTALKLFQRMVSEGEASPNAFTFAGVFTAASQLPNAFGGREAHAVALKTANCDNVFVGSSLLNMYCKAGLVSEARAVFDRMPERNSVTWAAMISGYAVEKRPIEAFELFRSIRTEEDCMSEYAITAVLSAVSALDFIMEGKQIHCLVMKNGISSFVSISNSIVTMYAKCECVQEAARMFEFSDARNSITWSAMITGLAQNGDSYEALKLFREMHIAQMKPSEYTFVGVLNACSDRSDIITGRQVHAHLIKLELKSEIFIKTALVDMYAKCGCVHDARMGFDQLHEPDIVLWTAMIGGYVQNGESEEALRLYRWMQTEGIVPNDLTLASILRACASLSARELGRQTHANVFKRGFGLEAPIGSALSTMYAKCGDFSDCQLVFRQMTHRDTVAWNSIISGYSQNGCCEEALELFEEMKSEGVEPNNVTFMNLLFACSHNGLVEKGWRYFESMSCEYDITPGIEHYACMVDILSRAGKLVEAKDFIESVPIDHGMHLWRILLGASKKHKNYDIGAYAGEKLIEMGSPESSAYVLLSNIYADLGRWGDVERVRRMMRQRGVNKETGRSWIELNCRTHVFVSMDQWHPETEEIYIVVKRVNKNMRDEECEPRADEVADFDGEMLDLVVGL
ncbi:Pentatricopeptide repeat-containing protein [Acorus gramineus]|uniref:Pentatricopeptide repeat-containing protein n=1 Tax=Acorus gramineus TaxID=55184 RepID=A0AAV9AG56_ACOGR|nr:Pentatricopeptide repeat-containing protein [Acorus gramineus]